MTILIKATLKNSDGQKPVPNTKWPHITEYQNNLIYYDFNPLS